MKRKLAAALTILPLSLALTSCGGGDSDTAPTPEETTVTTTDASAPAEGEEPVAAMSETEALEGLAAGISSQATVEQWRSLSKAVCEALTQAQKPLDEDGDTSLRAADTLMSGQAIIGTGDTPAQLPTEGMDGVKLALLIVNSTQLGCPEYQQDAVAAIDQIVARY